MGRIEKFRDYFRSARDLAVFLDVLRWALVLPGMIEKTSLERSIAEITPPSSNPRGMTRRLVVYVNFWLNRNVLTLRPTCLKRSLLLYRFLNLDGTKVRIHYGIKKVDGKLDGHSWLTLDGKPFLQDGLTAAEYRETFAYPPTDAGGRA